MCYFGHAIALDRLFMNNPSVSSMTRHPYSAHVQSPACFISLILLRSTLLDFQCATSATPIALDRLFMKNPSADAWPTLHITLQGSGENGCPSVKCLS